jgi:hypothetical protein
MGIYCCETLSLDPETPDAEVLAAIFQHLSSDALAAAAERVGTLAEPHDDTYFTPGRSLISYARVYLIAPTC